MGKKIDIMHQSPAKKYITTGCLLAALAVMLGAFGVHGLKDITNDTLILDIFDKAVRYQIYHAFAIILLGIVTQQFQISFKYIYRLFITGILFFSGSLYIITFLKIKLFEIPVAIGVLTPIGGFCFIAAWLGFAWQLYKKE
ncbi:MAG: DUF423 domain-containing protein [Bacteroidota bacterium]|nr:DUF423 domain-containing protein [Bacteroidota bacterium]